MKPTVGKVKFHQPGLLRSVAGTAGWVSVVWSASGVCLIQKGSVIAARLSSCEMASVLC